MAECVGGVTKILTNMNKKMNVPAIQGVLMEFQRENDKMDQAGEMLDDAMDDAFAEDGVCFHIFFMFFLKKENKNKTF